MIMTLIRHNGRCSVTEIAKKILSNDRSQIEYYEKITTNMVGRILRNHGVVEKNGKEYRLLDYESFSPDQTDHIVRLCEQKLADYVARRGERVWQHRRLSKGEISGTIKYEVLKKAQFHCELCGISADIKALEVDHIIPRNQGGTDDLSNFQALCYSCNSMKRDRDSTDFRARRESYAHREQGCLFCGSLEPATLRQNELAYAIRDKYPVTPLHTLVIPKRHVPDYFDLSRPEINACNQLLDEAKREIQETDSLVSGFNIGTNIDGTAGQTIFHCHIHLIPRRAGDIQDPTGGVRNLMPGKAKYCISIMKAMNWALQTVLSHF